MKNKSGLDDLAEALLRSRNGDDGAPLGKSSDLLGEARRKARLAEDRSDEASRFPDYIESPWQGWSNLADALISKYRYRQRQSEYEDMLRQSGGGK